MSEPITVPALVVRHNIYEMLIPVADLSECDHRTSICPDCEKGWRVAHIFTEKLPWDDSNPEPPDDDR